MRVLRLFQLPFGPPDLLLCDPKRFGRRSHATDGLGAEFAQPSESLSRRALAVSGIGGALQLILEFGRRVEQPKDVGLSDTGGHDERAPVESEPPSAVGSAIKHDLV